MATKKKSKRTRFVPHAILSTAFVGVIPACVVEGCGSNSSGATPDAGQFAVGQGVAVAAFFDSGQPDSNAPDAEADAPQFAVAVAAFFDSGQPPEDSAAPTDSGNDEGGHDSGAG